MEGIMNLRTPLSTFWLFGILLLALTGGPARSQTVMRDGSNSLANVRALPQDTSTAQTPAVARWDGQHDFDPLIGSWKYHLKRRLNPLTGSNNWEEFEGTGVCYKVWDGRAQLDTVELDGPGGHIEGLTLRLYDPKAHQWSLYWANAKDGNMTDPPQIGEFKNGRGEFYAQVMRNGRAILVRYDWSGMTSDSPHFEQAFSDDGGKTWEVNWITDQRRVKESSEKVQ
jgi:hypothetical protein